MKFVIVSLLLMLNVNLALAQINESERVQVEQKIALLEKAFSEKNVELLAPHLSVDLKIREFTGEIARKVLNAAVLQLSATKFENVNIALSNDGYIVTLRFVGNPQNREVKLNKQFQFTEINLFGAIVKKTEDLNGQPLKLVERIATKFELKNNLILLSDVRINGQSGYFIFDTGAPFLVLNSRHFQGQYNQSAIQSEARGISGAVTDLNLVKVTSFVWQNLEMKSFETPSTDLSHLEKSLGVEIKGLIGFNQIKDYEIIFDYQNKTLELHRADEAGNSKYARPASIVIPFELRGHLPVMTVQIAGKNLKMALDSGASANLIDENVFQSFDQNIYTNLKTAYLSGVNKNRTEIKEFSLKSVVINGIEFENMKTSVSSLAHLNAKNAVINIDGLLGYELLSRNVVALNFKNKQLKIYK